MIDLIYMLLSIATIVGIAFGLRFIYNAGFEHGKEKAMKECEKQIEETKELYKK